MALSTAPMGNHTAAATATRSLAGRAAQAGHGADAAGHGADD